MALVSRSLLRLSLRQPCLIRDLTSCFARRKLCTIPRRTFSTPGAQNMSRLLEKELAEEAGQAVQLPSPPAGWSTVENSAGKIEVVLKNASTNATIIFSSYEWESGDPVHGQGRDGPVDLNFLVLVDKRGAGTVAFHCVTDPEYAFHVTKVSYYADSALAHARTAEADWKRDELYEGPVFQELDHEVQGGFNQYVAELGVNDQVCNFIRDFGIKKEQKEYETWLSNVKRFMDA